MEWGEGNAESLHKSGHQNPTDSLPADMHSGKPALALRGSPASWRGRATVLGPTVHLRSQCRASVTCRPVRHRWLRDKVTPPSTGQLQAHKQNIVLFLKPRGFRMVYFIIMDEWNNFLGNNAKTAFSYPYTVLALSLKKVIGSFFPGASWKDKR